MGACLCIYGRYGTKLALTSAPMTSARMTAALMASALMASAPMASKLLPWANISSPLPCR